MSKANKPKLMLASCQVQYKDGKVCPLREFGWRKELRKQQGSNVGRTAAREMTTS
jgi:hypothetical protein